MGRGGKGGRGGGGTMGSNLLRGKVSFAFTLKRSGGGGGV